MFFNALDDDFSMKTRCYVAFTYFHIIHAIRSHYFYQTNLLHVNVLLTLTLSFSFLQFSDCDLGEILHHNIGVQCLIFMRKISILAKNQDSH